MWVIVTTGIIYVQDYNQTMCMRMRLWSHTTFLCLIVLFRRGGEIIEQLKCMGLSLDWSRSVFTMDEKVIEAVKHAFCELHEHGLIIRKHRMINWCCHLRSAIADIEVCVQIHTEILRIREKLA